MQKAVEKVVGVVNLNSRNDYLKTVEVNADNGKLNLAARQVKANFSMTITEKIPASVEGESIEPFFVPAKGMLTFAKLTANSENVNLKFDGEYCLKFNNKYSAVAFSEISDAEQVQKYLPKLEKAKSFAVDCKIFKRLYSQRKQVKLRVGKTII